MIHFFFSSMAFVFSKGKYGEGGKHRGGGVSKLVGSFHLEGLDVPSDNIVIGPCGSGCASVSVNKLVEEDFDVVVLLDAPNLTAISGVAFVAEEVVGLNLAFGGSTRVGRDSAETPWQVEAITFARLEKGDSGLRSPDELGLGVGSEVSVARNGWRSQPGASLNGGNLSNATGI